MPITRFMRFWTAAVLFSGLATALPAQSGTEGDPRPGLWDTVTPDAIALTLFNIGVVAVRSRMEVRYDYLSSDVARGSFALAGLTLRPNLYYDRARQCEITVERATLSQGGGALGLTIPLGISSGSVNLIGVEASAACLDPEFAEIARAIGLRRIVVDQARLDFDYDIASGEMTGALTLSVAGVAQLDLRARGTYLTQLDGVDPFPQSAVRLTEAVATLKDRGGWALVAPMLPGEMRDPAVIREIGTELLVDALSDAAGPLGATDRLFIDQLMLRVADYVADPGEITLEATLPPSGIVVSEARIRAPIDIVRALALTARTSPLARAEILPLADIEALRAAGPAGQLDLAVALLTGTGVPRSAQGARNLAEALVGDETFGARAALIVAQVALAADPGTAYSHALAAAAAGEVGAMAVLDAAEARLTSGVVLSLQPGFEADEAIQSVTLIDSVVGPNDDDPRALRQAALDRLYGTRAPRSYAQAYYFAILAEAAGDVAAESLIEEIDSRFGRRGAEAHRVWDIMRTAAENRAIEDWVALDLPARFRSN